MTNKPAQSHPKKPDDFSREEFEQFLRDYTHEIRNRLNSIALEAADLAEQAGPQADSTKLQQQIQQCSVFLREVRNLLAPEMPQKNRGALTEIFKILRDRDSHG